MLANRSHIVDLLGMHAYPSLEEFVELASRGNLIPVCTDLMADFETPVSVYSKLRESGPAFLLESIEGGVTLNRYSFIGYNPRRIFRVGWDQTEIIERDGSHSFIPTPSDPLRVIQDEMASFRPVKISGLPRFVGGAVGFIGYEYINAIEPSVLKAAEVPVQVPVLHFMLTDILVIFDRARQTLTLLVNAHVDGDARAAYREAVSTLGQLAKTMERGREIPTVPVAATSDIPLPHGNVTRDEYEQNVCRTKEYIRAGDVIQTVLSQRFEQEFHPTPLALYRALRVVNPSPYMFLYDPGDFALVGASPEVHVRLTDGLAELRPIAGTRPRGRNSEEDQALEADLRADEKERAEHLMLVDLARNDLGRVCDFGTVKVPEFMTIERYSHVMHIVSQVEGNLAADKNAYDLMRATFPAGTVSGAPKVRAMQIIAELEGEQRGPYGGAVTYFSYDGNVDSCIAIRTALLQRNRVFIQSGAGIVADSEPTNEFQETINKAKAMLRAVSVAEQIGDIS